jgi:hypothetical protein
MPRSRAEAKLAFAVASGKAKDSGMSAKYANEIVGEMHRRGLGAMSSLPKHARKIAGRGALFLALLIPLSCHYQAWAQPNAGSIVRINPFPSGEGGCTLLAYDGSSNLIYVGSAASIQTGSHAVTWAITPKQPQLTLTSIAVSSNVGTITVSGSTIKLQVGNGVVVAGSATTALNGTYAIQSVSSSTVVTITTVGVSNATYTDAALTVSTTAPRTDDNVWSIQHLTYSAGNLSLVQWALGVAGNFTSIWDNRTSLVYQ